MAGPEHRTTTAGAPMLRRFSDVRDYTIAATDGDIGSVEDLYFDDESWTVRHIVVDTGRWLSGRKVLISPASAAREEEDADPHLRSARAVTGYGLRATDGDLGHVEDFLVDEADWAIRYLVVDPRSWWPGPHVLLSTEWIRGVDWDDRVVELDVSRETVRGAPAYEASAGVDRQWESRLHAHYRRPGYWERDPQLWRLWPPAA